MKRSLSGYFALMVLVFDDYQMVKSFENLFKMKNHLLCFLMICSFTVAGQVPGKIDSIQSPDSLIKFAYAFSVQKEFEKAVDFNKKAERLVIENYGVDSELYGNVLNNYGIIYIYKRAYDQAEKYLLSALESREKNPGKKSEPYSVTLYNLGLVHTYNNDIKKANEYLSEAKDIQQEVLGKTNEKYLKTHRQLILNFWKVGDFDSAESHLEEYALLIEEKYGQKSKEYANCMALFGYHFYNQGKYIEVEPYFIKTKELRGEVLGKEDRTYATILSQLGMLYINLGKVDLVEPLHLESLAILKKILGEDHSEYGDAITNFAVFLRQVGRFEEAEEYYEVARINVKKNFGKKHFKYSRAVDNLGELNLAKGNFAKAEKYCLEAKINREKNLGKEHGDYSYSIGHLGAIYQKTGNYEKAVPLFLEAIDLRAKIMGKESPLYLGSLINIGRLFFEIGEFEKSEDYFLQATTIFENKLKNLKHPYYATGLESLGVLNHFNGKYSEAEKLLKNAIEVIKESSGPMHPDHARVLINLAELYRTMGQNENSLTLSQKANQILENSVGTMHPDYVKGLSVQYSINRKLGNLKQAESNIKLATALGQKQIINSIHHLSSEELTNYLSTFSNNQGQLLSYCLDSKTQSPDLLKVGFDNSLFYKGLALYTNNHLERLMSVDTVLESKYLQLKADRRQLSYYYTQPVGHEEQIKNLENSSNSIEKELSRAVTEFNGLMEFIKYDDLVNFLKSGEAIAEFVHFKPVKEKSDSILYAVYLFSEFDKKPKFIPLFDEKQLQSLLKTTDKKEEFYTNLYASRGLTPKNKKPISEEVYNLIWKPIEPFLKNVKTIHYSPSGLLHQLNMSAIPVSKTETLGDKYELNQLSSTRQIALRNIEETNYSKKDALVLGGIEYDLELEIEKPDTLSDVLAFASGIGFQNLDRGSLSRGESWKYLPGTAKEAKSINTSLKKAGYNSTLLSTNAATEAAIKSLGTKSASPRILHIATHGYFFPDPETNKQTSKEAETIFKLSDHPMIRSGLILAGGNRVWQGGEQILGKEDGILTAYEISQMNLTNTELVVLSACETGLGDIKGNEGVYGLQRAFKMAGVKYLVMSLWQVPDKQTQELMTIFYKNYLKKKMPIPQAFRSAQKKMRKKYDDPYSWAGFILVE